jgi:uncharacterized protein YbjT (DUF2867 family)
MPRILVFGATRGVGLAAVRALLAPGSGAEVTAFARAASAPKLAAALPGLALVQGDVRDAAAVAAALAPGFDALIISLGGAGIMAADDTCSRGTANILAALKASGARPKLVVCSSMGARESRGDIPTFVRWMLKHPLADKDVQEAAVEASGLPYCIVRPTGLSDSAPKGLAAVAAVTAGPTPTSRISRADVAAFLIAQAAPETAQAHKVVGISWRQ